nr:MAG TPA: hypothetical protein [Caudoviricetes sp.]
MKNQVTSIEQSKRLIELGVPAEKASMVWEMDEDCARLKIWNTDKQTRRVLHNKYPNYYVPAFTVADLLILLSDMAEKCGVSIRLHQEVGSICYAVYVGDCLICPYGELPFVDMLVEAVIYLEPNYSKCYKS